MMRVFVGSDHAGLPLKNVVRDYLIKSGKYDVIDVGTKTKDSCHYPQFARKMADLIKPEDRGILVCGSGIGIGMAANKCGMHCATAYNDFTAIECGRHFQVMAMGSRVLSQVLALNMVQQFLNSSLGLKKSQ